MNEYILDQSYDFAVDRSADINEDFFRIIVDEGVEVRLPKFRYQLGKPLPHTVHCRVKMIHNGVPVLSHVPGMHVYKIYGERDWRHESYDFRVKRIPQGPDSPYELIDDNGILFRLYDREARLSEGQRVRCRFVRLTDRNFTITRDYDEDSLQYLPLDSILDAIDTPAALKRFIRSFIESLPALASARAEHDERRAGWVVTAMQTLRGLMADMFARARVPRNAGALRALFGVMRSSALMLLENSEFMRNTMGETRAGLQRMLTETAESVEPYLKAIGLLTDGHYETYIMGMMEKLRKSGYLYHPKLQFATMMAIFRLKPELIKKALGRIYDAVMQWRLDTWTVEPFRSAFVEQFEIFVADARHRIDELPQPESDEDFINLENVLTAIALQLHIADPNRFAGYALNRSRLYRYASLARPRSSQALLDKSLYTLINGTTGHLEFSYDSIKNYTMMVTALSTPLHQAQQTVATPRVLRSGHVSVEIGNDGLSLRRIDEADARPVLPNGMMSWLSPQVFLEDTPQLNASKLRKFQGHQELWKQIELALLEEHVSAAASERLARADVGDDVEIIVLRSEPDRFGSNPRLLCEIVDPCFERANGWLSRSDIVDYRVKDFDPRAYIGNNGRPLHFHARVIACDDNGEYRFSLKEAADYIVRNEIANRTDEIVAVITAADGPRYSAIGDRGFGFFVERSDGFENLQQRTYVRVRLKDIPVNGNLVAEVVDYAHDGETVDKDTALVTLMRALGVQEFEEADEIIRDADEILGLEELTEIIELLRFKAIASHRLLEAVDYLGLARVLARVLGNETLAEMINTHMTLLGQHQFYADNTRIDADSIDTIEASTTASPLLERIFTRLRMVSWLGERDRLDSLASYVAAPRNELEGTIARLVSSYNMLADGAIADTDNLKFIKKRIADLLGVNNETHHLKHYGSESQYVEFKSSLVFPALKKGHTHSMADVERQHQEILQIIAGFLNSTGGTLFLGVSDQHYEKGLADDFAYLPKNVRTTDHLCVYLDNIVRKSYDLGQTVGNYVHISPDEESERGVIVVKVDPSRRPVMLGGNIFVRQSSSTVPMLGDDRRIFIADRERRYDEMMRIAGVELPDGDTDGEITPSVPAQITVPEKTTNTEILPSIATSNWRHNVLHDYEDGFYTPACYIYFNREGELQYSRADIYLDTDPDCALTLIVSPEDADGGYLVMAFEGELVAKVPLRELFEKQENTWCRFFDGADLQFATIARATDGLMCVLADSNAGLSARCTPLEHITECRLTSTPDRIISLPAAATAGWEQVATSAMPNLSAYMPDNLSTRQLGYVLRVRAGQDKAAEVISQLFNSCKPEKA